MTLNDKLKWYRVAETVGFDENVQAVSELEAIHIVREKYLELKRLYAVQSDAIVEEPISEYMNKRKIPDDG
jgi:hypothetical protein